MYKPAWKSLGPVFLVGVLTTALFNCAGEQDASPSEDGADVDEALGVSAAALLPPPDPTCQTGILSGNVCCAVSCGTCGGAGCSGRPGGTANCCASAIQASGVSCSGSLPPCIVTR